MFSFFLHHCNFFVQWPAFTSLPPVRIRDARYGEAKGLKDSLDAP